MERRNVAVSSNRVVSCCRMCRERGQTWSGDKPQCAFPNGVFVHENWNCATANALRDLCGEWANTNDDQNAAILKGVEECPHVCLTWYKRRGRTDGAWMIYDNDRMPEPLTLTEAERIITANAEIGHGGTPLASSDGSPYDKPKESKHGI